MDSMKRYEILPGLPPYGPMYVPVAQDGRPFASEGFVVRVYRSDGSSWVANCARAFSDFEGVFLCKDSEQFVIIAGGEGYLIHPNDYTPRACFGIVRGVVPNTEDRLVFFSDTEVTVIEPDASIWHSERIGYDGLKELACQDDQIKGLAFDVLAMSGEWQETWVPFAVNLTTRQVSGGPFGVID